MTTKAGRRPILQATKHLAEQCPVPDNREGASAHDDEDNDDDDENDDGDGDDDDDDDDDADGVGGVFGLRYRAPHG